MMNIKKITWLGIMAMCITTTAFASGAGYYFGAQLGQSNLNNKTRIVYITPSVSANPSNTGLGGRIFAGYGINKYAAFEMGFTRYSPSTYSVSSTLLTNDPTIRENGADFVAKGIYTFSYGFGVFGKAGVAFIRQSLGGSLNSSPDHSNGTSTFIRPTAALGV